MTTALSRGRGGTLTIVTVLLLTLIEVSGETVCLSCKDAVHPRDCTTVTRCGSHSACYTDAYVTDLGYLRYNLGCRDLQQCVNSSRTTGKRSSHPEELECSECCTGDLCSNNGCKQYGYPPQHSRGPLCFSCPRQQTTNDCQVIAACGRDEVCKLKRILLAFGSTQEIQYETMCEYKQKCDGEVNFYKQPSAIGKKRSSDEFALGGACLIQCCTDDLCNTGCTDWTATTQILTIVQCHDEPSCSLLMSSYDVCKNTAVAQQFCPRSCGMCPGSRTTTATTTTTPFPTTRTTTTFSTTTTTAPSTTSTTDTIMDSTTTNATTSMVSPLPTYGPELANLLYVGARVVRGKDWKWGTQDGNGPGEVVSLPADLSTEWVRVKWDHGSSNVYRMGRDGAYDLMLVPGSYNPSSGK